MAFTGCAATVDGTRIALAGDWGTGTDEAFHVASHMRAFRPHYTIHLGDVYYVGDPAEVGANFLGVPNPRLPYKPCKWPIGSEGAFALNGNHEMLARGFGYFDHILPRLGLRGSPNGQRASFFCLQNEHWRILALDTGYNSVGAPIIEHFFEPDCTLPDELIDWLRTVVRPQPDDPRGIVILTHHQYVSRFDHCYPKPAQQLAEFSSVQAPEGESGWPSRPTSREEGAIEQCRISSRSPNAPWHAETVEAAVERCGSSAQGLTSAEAAERLKAERAEPPCGRQAAFARGAALRPRQQPPDLCPGRFGADRLPARPRRRHRGHHRRRCHQRDNRLHPGGPGRECAGRHSRAC